MTTTWRAASPRGRRSRRSLPALVSMLLSFALLGCVPVPPTVGPGTHGPIHVVEVVDVSGYYYACGNEVLSLDDGRAFYPLQGEERDEFDEAPYAQSLVGTGLVGSGLVGTGIAEVAPPGPGDETGTLTIYEDGMAHWVADSGIEAWLTDEPQTYDWIC